MKSQLALAQSVADAANEALQTLSTVSYLLPSRRPLKDGLTALRTAYKILGVPEKQLPWDLGEDRVAAPEPPPKSETRLKPPPPLVKPSPVHPVRKRKAKKEVPVEAPGDESSDNPEIEASRCRAFLLEIVRRAVHDWVLYRQQEKRDLKLLAHNAYIWLFEEEPGHKWWETRESSYVAVRNDDGTTSFEKGVRSATSFLAICEAVGISPERVRKQARSMTVESILRAGRPAERRKGADNVSLEEHGVVINVDLQSLDEPVGGDDSHYVGYNSYTPDYM
jgi:hypothetical protein